MTLLVLSDSHGRREHIERAIALSGKTEAVLFLGDGLGDLDPSLCDAPIYAVRGNCDCFGFSHSSEPDERMITFGEYNVLMMHGHTHSVKSNPDIAIAYAAQKGADLLLYGHTHQKHEQFIPAGSTVCGITLKTPIRVMNPGSIGKPDSGYSFGTVTIRKKEILLGFGRI